MRRLAIFLDGTWNTLNNNTNVWRLKSLTSETADQRVYYSQGVGTRRGRVRARRRLGVGHRRRDYRSLRVAHSEFRRRRRDLHLQLQPRRLHGAQPVGADLQMRNPSARRAAIHRATLRAIPRIRRADHQIAVGQYSEPYWSKSTALIRRQSRSNQVSGRCLPKTGIFGVFAGDFCRNGMQVGQFGSSETAAELQKPANSGLFSALRGGSSDLGNAWLTWEDSNLHIPD
jgi:hypothetical protein